MQHLPSTSPGADHPGLTDEIKAQILDAMARLAQMPGFVPRRSQRVMIAEIAKTLAGEYTPEERVICAEGPTGTGKSLGYLLSAIPVAKARGLKLVVSTATVALQEQLLNKDLPLVKEQAGLEFTYALAKGRRRYVCDRNLEQLAGAGDQQDLDLDDDIEIDPTAATWSIKPTTKEVETVRAMREAREQGTWSGDLDEWKAELRPEFKDVITTDRAGCTGRACPFFEQCPFFAASDTRKLVDVVVANHALVLADLALGGGSVLPPPEETIYVFDEGHHLPGYAIEQNAARTYLLGPQKQIKHLATIPDAVRRTVPNRPDVHEFMDGFEFALKTEVRLLNERLGELFDTIKDMHPAMRHRAEMRQGKRKEGVSSELAVWRFEQGLVPANLRDRFQAAWHATDTLFKRTKKLIEAIKKPLEDGHGNTVTGMALASAQSIHARLEEMWNTFSLFSREPEKPNVPPVARWIEAVNGGKDLECCANPISAAQMLRERLWTLCKGAVVTSATLASLGHFNRLFEELGLGTQYGTRAVKLDSPFDYRRNAELVIPAMVNSPKNADEHTAEVIERMNTGLVDPNEGTLVLFASYKQMNAVAEGLNAELAGRVLIQGTAPRQTLLAEHRRRIEAGEGSILFGVASFAEGLDLPGKLCTHVIIAKLFFAVPDSPVERTRAEWLESLGRNPFIEISVPDASFKLIQAAGRLLRTETDCGRVTILDRRLVETRYGRDMLEALPPFRRVIERSRQAGTYLKFA